MIESYTVIALIPARGGSKRFPRKNSRPLAGKPLIAWTIELALAMPVIDRVAVSTDDPKIARVAGEYGVAVIQRPKELAGDDALAADVIRHAINHLLRESKENVLMVYLQPTSPLRESGDVSACLNLLIKSYDSAATYAEAALHPYQAWRINGDIPSLFVPEGKARKAGEKAYQLNGAVYAFHTARFPVEGPCVLFGHCGAVIMPRERSVDIDYYLDFILAEAIINTRGCLAKPMMWFLSLRYIIERFLGGSRLSSRVGKPATASKESAAGRSKRGSPEPGAEAMQMYGEYELNPHNILRYGWTKEFMEAFSSLQYQGIELAMPLIRYFHTYIPPLVDHNLNNRILLQQIQEKHGFYTFADVQKVLERRPPVVSDLSRDERRKMLAVQIHYLSFMLDRFPESEVLVIMNSSREEHLFSGKELPRSYRVFKFVERSREARPDQRAVAAVLEEADMLLQRHTGHPVFGHPQFRTWLRKRLLFSLKIVHATNRMFLEEPIRLVMSNVEVVNPGTTLSLLAAKYNLPYINAPTNLITDRNIIPTRAAYYCVWGEYYRDWLAKRGIEPSKIICTGNLRFEYDRHASSLDRIELAAQLHFPENNIIFTFTTQPLTAEINHTVMQWIERAVQGCPATVLIKRHPGDQSDYGAFEKTGQIAVVPESIRLYDLLPHIDYLMTISSTTAIEAAFLEKGIVVLQPEMPYHYDRHNNNYHSHLVRGQAGFVAPSSERLRIIVGKLCASNLFRKQIQQMGRSFLAKTIHKGASSTPSTDMYEFLSALLDASGKD